MGYTQKFESWQLSSADTWELKDLSGAPYNIPANAVCEIVMANSTDDTARTMGVRHYDSTFNRYIDVHEAEGGGVNTVRMHVQADGSSRIKCWTSSTADVTFYLVGYHDSGSYIETAPTEYDTTLNATWETITMAAIPAGKIGEVVLAITWKLYEREVGIREVGSSLERKFDLHEAEPNSKGLLTLFVEIDDNQQVQAYSEYYSETSFFAIGYWDTPPGTWTEKYQALDANSSPDVWEDEDLSAYITDGAIVEIVGCNNADAAKYLVGMRTNNGSLDRYLELDEAEAGGENFWSCHCLSDSGGVIELYADDTTAVRHYLTGQWVMAGGPTPGWNQLAYASEPPTANAWNQLDDAGGSGWVQLKYDSD